MADEVTRAPATPTDPGGTPGPGLTTPLTEIQPAGDAPATAAVTVSRGVAESSRERWPLIPGYKITGEIARGGMGLVLAARDSTLGREVAIKTLLPQLVGRAHIVAEFDREAHITAGLQHPGVPPVHQLGSLPDGTPFLAMKRIRGRTLHHELGAVDRIAESPRLIGVFEQICQTVGYAHSQGIIHRDLKPLNVMVGAFGEVQVMDWGLSKEVRLAVGVTQDADRPFPAVNRGGGLDSTPAGAGSTQAGSTKGTPAYMPPEQAKGEWDKVDARADVFSLGGILCATLTGKPPYLGPNAEAVLARAVEADLDDAFARLDGCGADAELVSLCKSCLSPNPDDRPANGKALADAVATYRAGVEERAQRAEKERIAAEVRAGEAAHRAEAEGRARRAAEAQAAEQRKRRRAQLALGLAIGVLLAAGGAFAWWQERQAEQRRLEQSEAALRNARSEAARVQAESDARDKQRSIQERLIRNRDLASQLLTQTRAALESGHPEPASDALGQAETRISEGGADDLRALLARCRSDLTTLDTLNGIDNASWSLVEGRLPHPSAIVPRFEKAFAEYGILVGTTPPVEAAARINGSFIRERLLTSLEVWFVEGGRDPAIRAVLAAADPDELRNEARATNYLHAILTATTDGKSPPLEQPVWFALAHGRDKRHVDRATRESLLRTALEAKPDSFALLMAFGLLHTDDPSAAGRNARWFQAATAVQPRNPTAWNNLGLALRFAGELREAAAVLKKGVRVDPRLTRTHLNLASVLYYLGDSAGSLEEYREAIRLGECDVAVYSNMAGVLHQSGDFQGAITACKLGIVLDPTYAPIYSNLGLSLRESGDLPGAIAAYKVAVGLGPRYATPRLNLASAYLKQESYTEAIEAAQEACKLDPRAANAHALLGLAKALSGDKAGGRLAFAEAVRLDPMRYETQYRKIFPIEVAPPPRAVEK